MKSPKQPTIRVAVRRQTDDERRRFAVAADLFLADIVRKVIEGKDTTRNDERASKQAIRRSPAV